MGHRLLKIQTMNFIQKLEAQWATSNSLLCVGLDPDLTRIPMHLQEHAEPIYQFCRAIVDATHDLVCAYKPQIAYFAGAAAEDQLQKLMEYIPYKNVFYNKDLLTKIFKEVFFKKPML